MEKHSCPPSRTDRRTDKQTDAVTRAKSKCVTVAIPTGEVKATPSSTKMGHFLKDLDCQLTW